MQESLRRAWGRAGSCVARKLPERRIIIQSPDGDRTISMGTRGQLMGIATSAMIAAWLTVGTANMVTTGVENGRTDAELARMTAQMQALKADTAALKGDVATTAQRIEARQQFLDALLTGKGKKLPSTLFAGLTAPARRTAEKAAEAGVLAPFAALEAKQLAILDRAAQTAETRLRDAETLIGKLGLSPSRFVAQSVGKMAYAGVGGPYVPSSGDADGQGVDPRFTKLFVNWQRVEQLEAAMKSIPAYIPVSTYTLTSSFGFRFDPFHGGGASHTGLDMAAPTGQPVFAAAGGTVVRASRFGGYGNAIDVDHGKGIITRYGHLSRIDVAVGEKVEMGEKIGAVGSTGRSTGPHLHYEVRIDGKPVNPRLFLESSNYILAYQKEKAGPALPGPDDISSD